GPGSSKSTWKATLDPGKNLPCSNSGLQRNGNEIEVKSSAGAEGNGQVPQQSNNEQKK
ncbi:unnamed protein product, partial [Adineta ricciae]